MNNRRVVSLVVGVVLLAGSTMVSAQEEAKPQLFVIARDNVRLSEIDEYIDGVKGINAKLRQHKFPFMSFVMRTMSKFCYALPVDSFADLDKIRQDFERVGEAVGKEDWEALGRRANSAIEFSSTAVTLARPDLSYAPEEPIFQLSPEKPCVMVVNTYYVRPGKSKEAEALAKELIAVCKKTEYPISFTTYVGVIGEDLPAYGVVTAWQDRQQMVVQGEKSQDLLGEEGLGILNKILSFTRRVETEEWQYLPKLSLFPEQD